VAVEPRTPPRSAVAAAAAAGSTAAPGSPRSGPSATKSPLVHGRTAAGPSSASRRAPDAAAAGSNGVEDGTETPGFGQGLIAAAACFLLRQAPPEGTSAAAASSAGPLGAAAAAGGVAGQIPVDPVSTQTCTLTACRFKI
jgi:hypothetical protein